MLELSLNELKLVAKSRGIKSYKSNKSFKRNSISKWELVGSKNGFYDETLKKVTKYFNDK